MDIQAETLARQGDDAAAVDAARAIVWPATRTIVFNRPVKLADREYAEARLMEPTVGQVEDAAAKADSFDQVRHLVSVIADIPYAALGSMPASAYQAASVYLMHFIAPDEAGNEEDEEAEQPETFKLIFAEPIEHNGKSIESLTLTEPTLSMLQTSGRAGNWVSKQVHLMAMAAAMSGGSNALIVKMKFSDFKRGRDYLAGFTAASAKIF